MIDIKEAFSYPFRDKDWPIKILLGTIFVYIPIVNFFSKGYAYTVFKAAVNKGDLYLPKWDNFSEYFVRGFWVFLIQLCYYFIPLFLVLTGGIMTVGGIGLYLSDKGEEFIGMAFIGALFLFVGSILGLITMLLYPMALANYARGGERFGEAFRLFDITSKVFRVLGDYVVAFVIIFATCMAIYVLCAIPFFGLLVALIHVFMIFYFYSLVWVGLIGQACSQAFSDDDEFMVAVPER